MKSHQTWEGETIRIKVHREDEDAAVHAWGRQRNDWGVRVLTVQLAVDTGHLRILIFTAAGNPAGRVG